MKIIGEVLPGSVQNALLAIGLFFTMCGQASASGWYGGISLGQATVDVQDISCADFAGPGVSCNDDDSDTSFKLFAGIEINPNFAVEFGYADLGSASLYVTDGIDFVDFKYEAAALFVTANGILPVSSTVKLFGKAGVARWDVDGTITTSVPGIGFSDSDDGFDLLLGLGASFNVAKNFDVRVEWERFSVGDSATSAEADIDVLSAGVTMKF